jgi:hypothetical protein
MSCATTRGDIEGSQEAALGADQEPFRKSVSSDLGWYNPLHELMAGTHPPYMHLQSLIVINPILLSLLNCDQHALESYKSK